MKDNILGKRIKELRIERRISQRQLGIELGFSNQTISTWESGQREPDCDSLIMLANFFDTSLDYLFGLTDI